MILELSVSAENGFKGKNETPPYREWLKEQLGLKISETFPVIGSVLTISLTVAKNLDGLTNWIDNLF